MIVLKFLNYFIYKEILDYFFSNIQYLDIKERQKQYYQENKERIIEKAKQYYQNHKEERQRYNQKYWEINGHKYIEQRKTSIDHKAKYLEMKEYHKEYHQKYLCDSE